jgi:hypothetical protein
MSPAGFEAAILSSEQPQAYALDSTATEADQLKYSMNVIM